MEAVDGASVQAHQDHYAALGVAENATPAEIAAAWKVLRRVTHPDIGGDTQRFAAVSEAYTVLSDTDRRVEYDTTRRNTGRLAGDGRLERKVSDYLASVSVSTPVVPEQRPAPLFKRLLRRA